ncbi:hypothetical protein JCM5805K_1273 [Lactococcus lactis subsp. lactis]|uniref:Uncharacterized protein n=1 Tax=Lactococcus lactis subsp. lactis TaxID=1360 RepID=A0A0B8QT63_LACLL|nr:hypothetical protein JCM5805K_1273 [Lactococcus lactis subsp. lactis]
MAKFGEKQLVKTPTKKIRLATKKSFLAENRSLK